MMEDAVGLHSVYFRHFDGLLIQVDNNVTLVGGEGLRHKLVLVDLLDSFTVNDHAILVVVNHHSLALVGTLLGLLFRVTPAAAAG